MAPAMSFILLTMLLLCPPGISSVYMSNSYSHCIHDDQIESRNNLLSTDQASKDCSPPGINHCFSVTGFGSDYYSANGVYCALNNTEGMSTLGHYSHMAKPNELRYEMMLSSKHQATEHGTDLVWSWMLVRVNRELTSRKNWVGMPIYQAKSFIENSMPTDGWVAGEALGTIDHARVQVVGASYSQIFYLNLYLHTCAQSSK